MYVKRGNVPHSKIIIWWGNGAYYAGADVLPRSPCRLNSHIYVISFFKEISLWNEKMSSELGDLTIKMTRSKLGPVGPINLPPFLDPLVKHTAYTYLHVYMHIYRYVNEQNMQHNCIWYYYYRVFYMSPFQDCLLKSSPDTSGKNRYCFPYKIRNARGTVSMALISNCVHCRDTYY